MRPQLRRHAIRRWSRWASRWSSATTRVHLGSRRSTCAYADALSMADNVMTFRYVVKEVALGEGAASFMPNRSPNTRVPAMHPS